MRSAPARHARWRGVEPLFEELALPGQGPDAPRWCWKAAAAAPALVDKVADDCGVTPEKLTLIYAPTQSLAGGVQVVARVLEVALHKAHELKFPLERDRRRRRRGAALARRIPIWSTGNGPHQRRHHLRAAGCTFSSTGPAGDAP